MESRDFTGLKRLRSGTHGGTAQAIKARHQGSNRQFAAEDELFRTSCKMAGVEPTKRQASKWRRKCGSAYEYRHGAAAALKEARNG